MKHRLEENVMIQLKLPFAGGYVCGIFHIFHQVCEAWYCIPAQPRDGELCERARWSAMDIDGIVSCPVVHVCLMSTSVYVVRVLHWGTVSWINLKTAFLTETS